MTTAPYGFIGSYVHAEGRIAVLVQLECNDSFTARTQEFRELAHNLAMHIAAAEPVCITMRDLDARIWEKEVSHLNPALLSKSPSERQKLLAEARVRFEEERCLLRQDFVKKPGTRVEEVLAQMSEKMKDSVRVGKFCRYEIAI